MSVLPDSLKLGDLSIPGTHDSLARYGGDFFETQSMPLLAQLRAGIRAFDVRCTRYTNELRIYHGTAYQNVALDDVLADAIGFLEDYSDETIVMRIKEENDPFLSDRDFDDILDDYLDAPFAGADGPAPRRNWVWQGASDNPTLEEIRRKIVILQDFGSDRRYGIRWPSPEQATNLRIQDKYSVPLPTSIEAKWNAIKDHFVDAERPLPGHCSETPCAEADFIWINFLSGTGAFTPYTLASGHLFRPGITHGFFPTTCPLDPDSCFEDFPKEDGGFKVFTEGMNVLATDKHLLPNAYIAEDRTPRVGIVMADFPGPGLIDAIIARSRELMDSDQDGRLDWIERNAGTDPHDSDSDDDGLSDGSEHARGTNPLDDDSDHDGSPDGREIDAGTDPLDHDTDDDGVADGTDVCGLVANADQADLDGDDAGDVCDDVDGALEIRRARIRRNVRVGRPNGEFIVQGEVILHPPGDVLDLSSGLLVEIADGGTLRASFLWTGDQCEQHRSGRVTCSASSGTFRLLTVPLTARDGRVRFAMRFRQHDVMGPFTEGLTVRLVHAPPTGVTGVDRVGAAASCALTANAMFCR